MLKVPYYDLKGMQDALDMFKFCYDDKLDYDLQRKAKKYRKTLKEIKQVLKYAMGAKVSVTAREMYEFSKFAHDIAGVVNMDDTFMAVMTIDSQYYGVRFIIKDIGRTVYFITPRHGDKDMMLMHIEAGDESYDKEIAEFHTAISSQFQFIYDTMLRVILDYINETVEVKFDFTYSNEQYLEDKLWIEINDEIDAANRKNWLSRLFVPIFS